MSAKSAPSANTNSGAGIIKNGNLSVMLNKYLANPPTIAEKLAVPKAPKMKAAEIIENKRKEAKEFLQNWQALWDEDQSGEMKR